MTAALEGLAHLHRGKVRDLYAVGDDLLLVASDRLSAFDVVMDEPIPDKGRVLTAMTAFWCDELADVVPMALLTCAPEQIDRAIPGFLAASPLAGRTMLARRAEMIPLECIVRARLAGHAYEEYAAQGTIHLMPAPGGLELADPLPEPMFTPSTKSAFGHDLNISFDEACELVGTALVHEVRAVCLRIFDVAQRRVNQAGLVLADTKFELGLIDGEVTLCDEVVTPDSSRLWPEDSIVRGEAPPAFDKQPFRDWLAAQPWDRTPPPPHVPHDVVMATSRRYVEAYERVTGRPLDDWYGAPS
ncbi:MAG TPA: phosphoribosylaminoimidazolesuccinocarboxamide synthase [Acidimicrobiales bacterium]|nr:phosphoribosylaminoimidazolesuccinocarboxamide synthase [Acidimicrobiales bacterium]